MTELLELAGLGAGYDGQSVCGSISVALQPGEGLALVGSNGSGKSTVLRTVMGRLAPVLGRVLAFGEPVDDRSIEFRRRVVGVFDDDAFFPSLSVAEHLALVATGHAVPDPEQAVADELDFFGLTSVRSALPSRLSSGQRRRVLLAAAFIRPSSIMCLDEPEQRLDAVMRRRLIDRLQSRRAEGAVIVTATHDADFVSGCADTVVVVSDEIRQFGSGDGAAALGAL
ncbi:ABC transporter ATP-binding protein [Curtobacterium sp. HSID17257]|uniref:ABC transporter ATP-binding protein n=1 Tax=Curtobacterium sp. HSID17257 TaxID=2419510 RepID=UPI000F899D9F|nr:ABC transporter ATP-binding protein [Curtobacterium sp. HSID17257]RUQ10134.1 ABC transporter ATP-binding protein [Curtobacterium sp. HSID17257]